jgi:leucyl/phenylalanyl-tRNA--protein transferase
LNKRYAANFASIDRNLARKLQMAIIEFPPVDSADEDGLLAIGGDLEPESLLLAYQSGIFPWPVNDELLAWFSPPTRAIISVDEFHISRSLERELKRGRFITKIDSAFNQVIANCAQVINRGDQDGTWITDEVIQAYSKLHQLGIAHSFETYLDGELVGGIYGLRIKSFFAAESSFYRKANASKIAMVSLYEYLKLEQIPWFDCQVLTPFSESFGAKEIPRDEYLKLLETALRKSD